MDDDAIRSLVTRLARPHPSGGKVIERAAILAEGTDCTAVLRWIEDHDGRPEDLPAVTTGRGLHSSRSHSSGAAARQTLRYVLPPGALN